MQYIVATVWRKEQDTATVMVLQMHDVKARNAKQALEKAIALGQQDIDCSHGPGFTRALCKVATITTT